MTKHVSTWKELDGLVSKDGKHRIDVNLELCSGWIHPVDDVPGEPFGKDNRYLSTHTFYESQCKRSTELLQNFGFDVELVSWG